MSRFDRAIDDFIVAKFVSDEGLNPSQEYSPEVDGDQSDITVLQADMGWVCSCWSDWTRDDSFEITALVKTKGREVEFVYGTWGSLPYMIEELDEYCINDSCYYESEDYKS